MCFCVLLLFVSNNVYNIGFLTTEAHPRRSLGRPTFHAERHLQEHIIPRAWRLLLLQMREASRNKPGPPQTCYDLHWRTVTFWGS